MFSIMALNGTLICDIIKIHDRLTCYSPICIRPPKKRSFFFPQKRG